MLDIDRIDRQILDTLQREGRLSNLELAERVHLSPSPCLRRVRRLEEAGAIRDYVALLDPATLGLGLTAFVNVRLDKRSAGAPRGPRPAERFHADVATWPEVVACYAMTGEMDYLLKVVTADMAHFSRLMHDCLLAHPAVLDVRTSFVLDAIKQTTALPLGTEP